MEQKTIKLRKEDFVDINSSVITRGSTSDKQFHNPNSCMMAQAIKREFNTLHVEMGYSVFNTHFPEFKGEFNLLIGPRTVEAARINLLSGVEYVEFSYITLKPIK